MDVTPSPGSDELDRPVTGHEEPPSIRLEQLRRPQEELNMLYMGFGLGLTIGFFFLVYVVLALATGESQHGFGPPT